MGSVLLVVAGVWLFAQATAGRLGARLLSYRAATTGDAAAALVAAATRAAGAANGTPGTAGDVSAAASALAGDGWVWPMRGTVTQEFGGRHKGIDIAAPSGTPVSAAAAGTVTQTVTGWGGGWGNHVVIDHGAGLSTRYAHLSSIAVRVGQRVTAGTLIGAEGSTGHSTGPHLHLEVMVNGSQVNPRSKIGGNP